MKLRLKLRVIDRRYAPCGDSSNHDPIRFGLLLLKKFLLSEADLHPAEILIRASLLPGLRVELPVP